VSVDVTMLVGPDEVTSIAGDVWTSLVGFEEQLSPLEQPPAHLPLDALSAWVLVVGPWSGSLVVTCAPSTAAALTRAVLRADDDEELTEEDVADALGEVANVIGGNVKSLLVEPSHLGLPQVGPGMEAPAGRVVVQLDLSWRGQPVCLSLRSATAAPTTTPSKEQS
jgi:hypothetical protein